MLLYKENEAMSVAKKANPRLWARIKKKVQDGEKGGKAGQWSARKAQIAVAEYKKAGGKYEGKKTTKNSLRRWTDQDWQYAGKEKESRYLPKKAIDALSPSEKSATNRAKKEGTKKGKQFVKQPKKVAKKTAKYRKK